MRACPRCGHDEPGDPTRTDDGDHTVLLFAPPSLTAGPVDRATNTLKATASQDVRMARCSELPPPKRRDNPVARCHSRTHVFDGWDDQPWCECGRVRNRAFKRSLLDRLLGKPKRRQR